jgi:lipopolysaccharide biosynthesis glycosyltransferase
MLKNLPFVLACDAGYAMPLTTTLRSIVESNQTSWPLNFHLLSEGFSNIIKDKVEMSLPKGSASIRWVQADLGLFQNFNTQKHISKITFARILLPNLFSETVSKVLFLDTDILVLKDLTPLLETELEGCVLGAVLDGLDPILQGQRKSSFKIPKLNIHRYFNAGVLLVDLNRWRQNQISERAIQFLIQNPDSPFSDQDALNVACDGLWFELPSKWNFQDHFQTKVSEMNDPAIVHFINNSKPWIPKVRSPNAGFYDSFRDRTRFARSKARKLKDGAVAFASGVRNVLNRTFGESPACRSDNL